MDKQPKRLTVVMVGWTKYPNWAPSVHELTDQVRKDKDYVILSEPIELEFTLLSPEDILQGRLGKLQEIKAEIVNDFGEKLSEINNTIAEFQSLSYDGAKDSPAPCEDSFVNNNPV